MKLWIHFIFCISLVLLVLGTGCETPPPPPEIREPLDPTLTIEAVARVHYFDAIPVRGIGIVAGLHGTGSSECPPMVRENLEKFIWTQIPVDNGINARAFIDSKNTAVVEVFGVIPPLSSDRSTFDVMLRPLSGSQTTSLDGGHLYPTELKELSRLTRLEQFAMFSKSVASVEGPVYSNNLSQTGQQERLWYVLGGGRPIQDSKIRLVLYQPDFITANAIRNRINARFRAKTAIPVSDAEILLEVPANYRDNKQRFLEMVKSLQLGDNPDLRQYRIDELTAWLLSEPENEAYEIALEAIGRPALDTLAPLLTHPDESVQFHVARCMLNIGDKRALKALRRILLDTNSPYRLETVKAIGRNANNTEARAILTVALNDSDIQVRLAAYEMLLGADSPAISRKVVAGEFVVDSVICPGPKMIYVYQQNTPRIVLFGSPIYCKENLFIQSDDGMVTINAKPGDRFISVSRRHPQRPRVIGPLNTGFEVSSLIQALGGLPEVDKQRVTALPGLSISYTKILPILEKMCLQDAIPAVFIAGPPVTVDPMLQNLPPIGR